MKKRQVMAITAIRSEYFLQRSIFRSIMDHPDLISESLLPEPIFRPCMVTPGKQLKLMVCR
jgi:hypothetical protein